MHHNLSYSAGRQQIRRDGAHEPSRRRELCRHGGRVHRNDGIFLKSETVDHQLHRRGVDFDPHDFKAGRDGGDHGHRMQNRKLQRVGPDRRAGIPDLYRQQTSFRQVLC